MRIALTILGNFLSRVYLFYFYLELPSERFFALSVAIPCEDPSLASRAFYYAMSPA